MKKSILFTTLLIVGAVAIPLAIDYTYRSFNPIITPIPTPVKKPIRVPINIFEGERSENSNPPIGDLIINKSLNTVFGFTMHPELSQQGRNEAWTVSEHINGPPWTTLKDFKDPFGAVAIALISFSPDNHYLAFRTRAVLGAAVYSFVLVVFDIQDGKTINISAPDGLLSFKGGLDETERFGWETFPYIESYEWNDSKLNMVMYTIKYVNYFDKKTNALEYYRIEPKQLWQYDLILKQYTFLKNLDE